MMPEALLKFPSLKFEQLLWDDNITRVAGMDEAGRGAWAGPVCVAAVILPAERALLQTLKGVRDSKLMTPLAREQWSPRIRAAALAWGVAFASSQEIDRLGIVPATKLAATRALEPLSPQYLIADYRLILELELNQTSLIKGEQHSLSVAAASVLAKTARDAHMRELDGQYPGYCFARHKGYGTKVHREAIRKIGMCAEHRKSFTLKP